MTNQDQADMLANLAAELGLNKDQFDKYRDILFLALNNASTRAVAGMVFKEEELARLKKSYDWACARLSELEVVKP